jgi:hypothetical protein
VATKFFLLDAASDINPGADIEKDFRLTAGSSLAVSTSNTAAAAAVVCTNTAGGTDLQWLSRPLDAVTISGTVTVNVWMAESNMSANVAAYVDISRCNNAGTALATIGFGAKAAELPVTTRAAQNFTLTPTSTNIGAGERIRIQVVGDQFGTMASGFTFTLGYNGATGAADGDSWLSFTETITEQSAAAADMPYVNPMRQLIAH